MKDKPKKISMVKDTENYTRISILIPIKVKEFFEEKSTRVFNPYQLLIREVLIKHMEEEKSGDTVLKKSDLRKILREELAKSKE